MKIVYCLNSIRHLGGIQRATIAVANAVATQQGYEVYVVVTDNKKGVLVHPLSPSVRLIDLDVNYYEDDWRSRWHVVKGIVVKRCEHKRKLTRVLNDIQPDVVVSVGQAEKYMLPSIHGDWATVRWMRFEKNYRTANASTLRQRMSAALANWYDYKLMIKRYDRIVVQTQEDKVVAWKGYRNVVVIPNPISFKGDASAALGYKKVVAFGRLSRQKNYSSLIRAFRKVVDKHPDWTLEIFGEGEERQQLEQLIKAMRLSNNVALRGYTANVAEEMLAASCFVLSSIFEGFPNVIVEAMQMGLPVVSYACPCGPKDIITEGEDGFLVAVNDEEALADRICRLIEDEALRRRMGQAAKRSVKRYSMENIVSQWMAEFNQIIKKRH